MTEEFTDVSGHFPLYRVKDKEGGAEAVHENLLEDCRHISIKIEGLLRGDLVAVKELYRNPDGKWAAQKIKVLQTKKLKRIRDS
uniref:SH3 domain-containing protein n=1 Tax=Caenorhabditis tropicalis TaxID=1561998 RepID=A0A1I7T363_9PELO